ncbi:MAG TPA: condensation domain-containing protein, partial [Bacilli bacterium]|nr:condensation domain-containing protein [Bacilli bacterium]
MSKRASLEAMRKKLSPEQLALLEQRLRGKDIVAVQEQEIPKRAQEGPSPLSFAQQRQWFLSQLEPESPAYNIFFAIELNGALRIDVLERSFYEVIQRHESLRTSFTAESEAGEAVQVIAQATPFPLPLVELQDLPEREKHEQVERLARQEARTPFDLTEDRLIRARLLKLSEVEHILLLTQHHIVTDGWSLGVLITEMAAFYDAFVSGNRPQVPELSIQYADFALWQREWFQGEELRKQLDYWKGKLGGSLPVLQLPTDFPRPPMQTDNGARRKFLIPQALLDKLEQIGRQAGATLFMTLLTAFNTFLYRYTGQEDLLVGTPIAGRNRAQLEPLIGFFVNTLVMRSDLSGDPTFGELLARVKDTANEAYAHQDLPFETLVQEVQPARNASYSPIFQVMMTLNPPVPAIELQGLTMRVLDMAGGTSKFDLLLELEEVEAGMTAVFEYNTDLYASTTIERMEQHFLNLLAAIAKHPEQKLWELSLLDEAEREQLLYGWNDTETAFPRDKVLHTLFEEQAARTPERVAAVYGEQELTYGDLEAQSNRLAHHLLTLGVGPDVPVGLCMERSLDMVIGLLAILKAGGAYVPLDSDAPPARIAQVLEDAQAPVCLTLAHLQEKIPLSVTAVLASEQELATVTAHYPDTKPDVAVTSDHLVSIYYTSGSTGKPKGVSSTHEGWVNRMCWMQNRHDLQPEETVLQKTTLTFDDAAVEFFWPLMVGARIALLEPDLHKDPRAIIDATIRYQAAVVQFVPSMLTLVLDALAPQDAEGIKCLRVLVSSGEALRSDVVRKFFQKLTHRPCILTNTWGATEVSIDSTIHIVTEADGVGDAITSVGRPIDNNTCYVLDAHLQPVPVGVAGDLYLGGIGLARDYLNDPERTLKAFIPNPYR